MAEGALSIKLRCASWQQLATIYKRDLSHGTMFLRAATPPPVGTVVRIDLTLPSATVIALDGVVAGQVQDPQRGSGIELTLSPIPASSVWLIESALASEARRRATPARSIPVIGHPVTGAVPTFEVGASVSAAIPAIPAIPTPAIHDHADLAVAEQDLIKALVSEAESLKKLNPFLVLGVGYEAGDAEIRTAFGELTKRYHPDRFARYESTELRQLAAEIFILIRDAYRRLGDAAGRAQVLQSLGKSAPAPRAIPSPSRTPSVAPPRATQRPPSVSGAPAARDGVLPTVTVPVPTVLRPPVATRRPTADPTAPAPPAASTPAPGSPAAPGRSPASTPPPTAARGTGASPFAQTQQAPVLPAALDPAELAALEDLIDQARLDEALSGYRMLARRHAHDRNVRAGVELCEGLLALAARDRLEAAQRFETALEIDPSNERAARELAEMRRQATHERKGLLSRLMGKKEP
jgi:tetratricopeptide (TPR) repeat protein